MPRPARSWTELAQRWPSDGQIMFLLGQCEELLGRPDRALAAWGRVPVSDPNFVRAAESQASVLINQGRFAPAETLLFDALRTSSETNRYPLLRVLARLFRLQGRFADVSEVLTAAWSHAPDRRKCCRTSGRAIPTRPRRRLESLSGRGRSGGRPGLAGQGASRTFDRPV